MAKTKKMNDFRTLNMSKETTPTKKNVGAVSASKKSKNMFIDNDKETKNKKGLILFFIFLVILGAFVGCMFTPVFNVTEIIVQEGNRVSQDEIMSKLDGVVGENIFRVNTSSIKKAIRAMAYIRSVEIKRNIPDTISITFEEREPYAIIKYLESYVIMDKYGYVLEIKKENDLPELTIIYGIDSEAYIVGKKIEDVAGLKYENLTYLLETSHKNTFDYIIREINYTDTENLIMYVNDLDVDINFGAVERDILVEKMSYLNGILKRLKGKKGKLDISSNNYLEKTIFTERY